ncbi:uncharacterized protein V1510DRAFT_404595 [Dipodascopsis tothii]|uniref:uncharacterized protein n=1 Tax=Dipodascopsis tothii TaxID=44089 RepID=UPI0034CFC9F8
MAALSQVPRAENRVEKYLETCCTAVEDGAGEYDYNMDHDFRPVSHRRKYHTENGRSNPHGYVVYRGKEDERPRRSRRSGDHARPLTPDEKSPSRINMSFKRRSDKSVPDVVRIDEREVEADDDVAEIDLNMLFKLVRVFGADPETQAWSRRKLMSYSKKYLLQNPKHAAALVAKKESDECDWMSDSTKARSILSNNRATPKSRSGHNSIYSTPGVISAAQRELDLHTARTIEVKNMDDAEPLSRTRRFVRFFSCRNR